MRTIGFSLIVFAATSMPAHAVTGEELLAQCSAPAGSSDRWRCEGYVQGVANGATMLAISMRQIHPGSDKFPLLFCVASTVPAEQLVSAAINYLKSNPGSRHYDAASELLLAFQQAFPCSAT